MPVSCSYVESVGECNEDVPDCSREICGNDLDDDCDGTTDEDAFGDCVGEVPCNDVDDDVDPNTPDCPDVPAGPDCRETGKPIDLMTRQFYAGPWEMARISSGRGDPFDLVFDAGYDSEVAFRDASAPITERHLLGAGMRSRWEQRLVFSAGNRVVTWERLGGSVRFLKDGSATQWRAEPGHFAVLTQVGSTLWRLQDDDGTVYEFIPLTTGPNGISRLRSIYPRGHSQYRFLVQYEDDVSLPPASNEAIPPGACTGVFPDGIQQDCDATRKLPIRIATQWLSGSSMFPGPSFELRYKAGSNGEILLSELRIGTYRSESATPASVVPPTLTSFEFFPPTGAVSQLKSVRDARRGSGTMAKKLGFLWNTDTPDGLATRLYLTTVTRPAVKDGEITAEVPEEEVAWVASGIGGKWIVKTASSERSAMEFVSASGSSRVWRRNNCASSSCDETYTYDADGWPVTCGNQQCGDPSTARTYATPAGAAFAGYRFGTSYSRSVDGVDHHRSYDSSGRLVLECDVVPSGTSPSTCALNGNAVAVTGGGLRAATRSYFVAASATDPRTRARIRLTAPSSTSAFPSESTVASWHTSVSGSTCPTTMVPTTVPSDIDVTLYVYNSDGDATFNEAPSLASGSFGDFAVTRTYRFAKSPADGVTVDRVCNNFAVDGAGRAGMLSPGEVKFVVQHGTSDAWVQRGDVRRVYQSLAATTPRLSGREKQHGADRVVPTALTIVDWRWCTVSGAGANVIDDEGRVVCSERPSGSQVTTTSEVTTTVASGIYAGATKRTTTISGPVGTSVSSFVIDTAWGLRLEEGALQGGVGNVVQHRVPASATARAALLEAATLERRSDGTLFSKTTRTYDAFGRLTDLTVRDGSNAIVRQQTFEAHDLDGRAATRKDWKTSTTFDATTYTWDQATDQLETMVEPDQALAVPAQRTDLVYGAGAAGKGRVTELTRGTSASPISVRSYEHDENGDLTLSATSSMASAYFDGFWNHDGFGRVVRDGNLGADIVQDLTYADDGNTVLTATIKPGLTVLRGLRYESDALGRPTRVCDTTTGSTTCPTTVFAYGWDSKGVFAGQAGLTDNHQAGRLGFVQDANGATFYEYDSVGRVTMVARYVGAIPINNVLNAGSLAKTTYAYAASGAIASITYPQGRVQAFVYGVDHQRPTSVTVTQSVGGSAVTVANAIVWDAAGSGPLFWRWGANTSGYGHTVVRNRRGFITSITDAYATTNRSQWTYTYDGDGDLTREDDVIAPTAQVASPSLANQFQLYGEHAVRDALVSWEDVGGNRSITLDPVGRRVSETSPSGVFTYTWLDVNGPGFQRLAAKSAPGVLSEERSYSYYSDPPGSDELAQITGIDQSNNGSIDVRLSYGPFGEVKTTSTSVGTYTHKRDHEMRRVLKQDPFGVTTTWRYGVGRNPLEETTGNITTSWFYLAGVPLAAVASNTTTSNLFYVYADRMNTPRKVIRSNAVGGIERRLAIDPWGHGVMYTDFVSSSGPQPNLSLRRSGQIQDTETKLIDNGYRMLMPDVGQYTSPEPLHLQTVARTYGPQSYAYAAGRPLSTIDPDGRSIYTFPYDNSEQCLADTDGICRDKDSGTTGGCVIPSYAFRTTPCRKTTCDQWGFDVDLLVSTELYVRCGLEDTPASEFSGRTMCTGTVMSHERSHASDFMTFPEEVGEILTEGFESKEMCEFFRATFDPDSLRRAAGDNTFDLRDVPCGQRRPIGDLPPKQGGFGP